MVEQEFDGFFCGRRNGERRNTLRKTANERRRRWREETRVGVAGNGDIQHAVGMTLAVLLPVSRHVVAADGRATEDAVGLLFVAMCTMLAQ